MKPLTSTETAILNTHPDQLGTLYMIYLKLPDNQAFLNEYRRKWASVVEPRRVVKPEGGK